MKRRFNVDLIQEMQRKCDAWNLTNKIGCPVVLTKDGGEKIRTKTRSHAQILSGHSAVIWLEGVRGCHALDRVRRA